MSRRNRSIGEWGENVASQFLESSGYQLLERNARTPYGEIDIVAEKDGIPVFVEVKTRSSSSLGPPEMAITLSKQAHMLAAAEFYAQQHNLDHWQIDVVAIRKIMGKHPEIMHFEKALD
jgi:putative endonuclease